MPICCLYSHLFQRVRPCFDRLKRHFQDTYITDSTSLVAMVATVKMMVSGLHNPPLRMQLLTTKIDTVNLETTDTRRLTRLMFGDIITVHEGTALKFYVSKTAVRNTSAWWHDTFQFAVDSLHLRPIRMHSRDFYVFDVTVSCDTEHHGVTSGTRTL